MTGSLARRRRERSGEKETVKDVLSGRRRRAARLRGLFLDRRHRFLLRRKPHALPLGSASGRGRPECAKNAHLFECVNQGPAAAGMVPKVVWRRVSATVVRPQHAGMEIAEASESYGSEEVLWRAALTSISRACSRSVSALTSTPAPSSVDAHASSGAFVLMNSHLSTSPKRAKRTGSSLSANLPITSMSSPSTAVVRWSIQLALVLYYGRATTQAGEAKRYSAHQRSTLR